MEYNEALFKAALEDLGKRLSESSGRTKVALSNFLEYIRIKGRDELYFMEVFLDWYYGGGTILLRDEILKKVGYDEDCLEHFNAFISMDSLASRSETLKTIIPEAAKELLEGILDTPFYREEEEEDWSMIGHTCIFCEAVDRNSAKEIIHEDNCLYLKAKKLKELYNETTISPKSSIS